jgi:hypothetical protein
LYRARLKGVGKNDYRTEKGTAQQEIDALTDKIVAQGVTVNPVIGADLTIPGADRRTRAAWTTRSGKLSLRGADHACASPSEGEPRFHPDDTVVDVAWAK